MSLVVCLSLLCMTLPLSQVLFHNCLSMGLYLGSIALERNCASGSWIDLYGDGQITEITLFLRFEKHFRSSKSMSVVCAFMGHRDQLLYRMECFNRNIFYCRSRYADMLHDKDRVSIEAKPFWMVGKEPLHFPWIAVTVWFLWKIKWSHFCTL